MPLYTYIAAFKGATYVAQGSYGNFKGFVSAWSGALPENALPGLTAPLRKELSGKAYCGEFVEVPNRKHVWRKTIDLFVDRSTDGVEISITGDEGDGAVRSNRSFDTVNSDETSRCAPSSTT